MGKILPHYAYEASREGSFQGAAYVMRWCMTMKRWTEETLRARWDGAAALLYWWHSLDPALRPPLDDLRKEEARAFIACLERMGLARSTIKGYRAGARALTRALRGSRTHPFTPDPDDYDPFCGVQPEVKAKPAPEVDEGALAEIENPRIKAKLEVLLALMAEGISLSQACSCTWRDVSLEERQLRDHLMNWRWLGARSVTALERLARLSETRGLHKRVLWRPDTARRWLKRIAGGERAWVSHVTLEGRQQGPAAMIEGNKALPIAEGSC